jgi:hypothetical protein
LWIGDGVGNSNGPSSSYADSDASRLVVGLSYFCAATAGYVGLLVLLLDYALCVFSIVLGPFNVCLGSTEDIDVVFFQSGGGILPISPIIFAHTISSPMGMIRSAGILFNFVFRRDMCCAFVLGVVGQWCVLVFVWVQVPMEFIVS